MPMPVSRLNNDGDKPVSITKGADTLNFVYNRKNYTVAVEAELQERAATRRLGSIYSHFLENIMVSWDAVDWASDEDYEKAKAIIAKEGRDLSVEEFKEAGVKFVDVPLNLETLQGALGVDAIITLVNAIGESNRPNESQSDFTSDI